MFLLSLPWDRPSQLTSHWPKQGTRPVLGGGVDRWSALERRNLACFNNNLVSHLVTLRDPQLRLFTFHFVDISYTPSFHDTLYNICDDVFLIQSSRLYKVAILLFLI